RSTTSEVREDAAPLCSASLDGTKPSRTEQGVRTGWSKAIGPPAQTAPAHTGLWVQTNSTRRRGPTSASHSPRTRPLPHGRREDHRCSATATRSPNGPAPASRDDGGKTSARGGGPLTEAFHRGRSARS